MANILNNTLGKLGDLTKKLGRETADESKKFATIAVQQVGMPVSEELGKEKKEGTASQAGKNPEELAKLTKNPDEEKQYTEGLYGITTMPQETVKQVLQQKPENEMKEKQALLKLRQTLHQTVNVQPLMTRQKTQEEVERPAERVERKEQEDRWELQKKEEKKKPVSVQWAETKTEIRRGPAG